MQRTARLLLIVLLGLLGCAGLLRLSLMPPLVARTSGDGTLSELEAQESLQEVRQQAASLMSRFVGGEITRHYWGGFTPYLDVLGLEVPLTMESELNISPEKASLALRPRRVAERYLAEVQLVDNMPRGVACRGQGKAGPFQLQGRRLGCPGGWIAMTDPLVRANSESH
jgi:hypothetical protein